MTASCILLMRSVLVLALVIGAAGGCSTNASPAAAPDSRGLDDARPFPGSDGGYPDVLFQDAQPDTSTSDAAGDAAGDVASDAAGDAASDAAGDTTGDASSDAAGDPELPPMDFEAAATYSRRYGGGAMMVSVGGRIVFERYQNGSTASKYFSTASGGKSFWGVATLALIADNLLEGSYALDQPASVLIDEWAGTEKEGILLEHLPYLVSGLSNCGKCYGERIDPDGNVVSDTFAYAINRETMVHPPPGSTFEYSAVGHFAWGSVIQRRAHVDPKTYFTQKIMDPIGMKIWAWPTDDAGNPRMHGGYFLTARNYLKFGNLVANRGEWLDGRRVLPDQLFDLLSVRRLPNPGHAMFFWQNDPEGEDAAGRRSPVGSAGGPFYHDGYPEMFAALGGAQVNQILAIFPRQRMVVLRLRNCGVGRDSPPCGSHNGFDINEFFTSLLGER
jgi:CubicO group peptidase (beta-lactamase class C family)